MRLIYMIKFIVKLSIVVAHFTYLETAIKLAD